MVSPEGTVTWKDKGKVPPWQNDIDTPEGLDYSCPATPWRDNPDGMFTLYDLAYHYRNGFLPMPGGVLDQPARLMEAIAVLLNMVQECEQQAEDQDAARAARHKRIEAHVASRGQ